MEGIVQVQSAKINHVQVYVYEVFPMICFGTKSVCGLHACTYKRSIIISKQLLTYDWSGRIKAFHAVEIIRTNIEYIFRIGGCLVAAMSQFDTLTSV